MESLGLLDLLVGHDSGRKAKAEVRCGMKAKAALEIEVAERVSQPAFKKL